MLNHAEEIPDCLKERYPQGADRYGWFSAYQQYAGTHRDCAYHKNKDVAIALHLAYNGTDEAAARRLVAEIHRHPLYPVPKLMDANKLEQFYCAVMEETK